MYSLSIKNGKPMPFQPFILALFFCALNSCAQTRTLGHLAQYPDSWLVSYHFVTGVALFSTGMAVNIHSDYILRNLREPGETGYKIPKGKFGSFMLCLCHLINWNVLQLLHPLSKVACSTLSLEPTTSERVWSGWALPWPVGPLQLLPSPSSLLCFWAAEQSDTTGNNVIEAHCYVVR